jgi:hypothetical protein
VAFGIEQVAEVLGRKPRAFVWVDRRRGETIEQATERYLAHRPEHANAEFIFMDWRLPDSPGSPERPMGSPPIGTV